MKMTKPQPSDIETLSPHESRVGDVVAASWWKQWNQDHHEQIKNYNDDVAKAGTWSDGLRLF